MQKTLVYIRHQQIDISYVLVSLRHLLLDLTYLCLKDRDEKTLLDSVCVSLSGRAADVPLGGVKVDGSSVRRQEPSGLSLPAVPQVALYPPVSPLVPQVVLFSPR